MRYLLIIIVFAFASCKESTPTTPAPNGVIIASVTQTGNIPEAGKLFKIVETNDSLVTNINGEALFTLPAGTYTVRAFGLNHGGPVFAYIDSTAVVKSGDTTRIHCWDCPQCM